MHQFLHSFHVNGDVTVPASKSYLQRYIALASLCSKKSIIKNINWCDDVQAAVLAAIQMGAQVTHYDNTLEITGISTQRKHEKINLDIRESGLSARMFGFIAPALFKNVRINGTGSILKRSMLSLIETLQKAGCEVESSDNKLPLVINGFANYQDIAITTTDTSQIITGLLYASWFSENNCTIKVLQPVSIPYIDISIHIAKMFGISIQYTSDYTEYYIRARQQIFPINTTTEGDWSAAAFFAVAAALSGECRLHQLNPNSLQGDKKIVEILQQCGAYVEWESDVLLVKKQRLKPFIVDLNHYPDLFPPLCVLAAGIQGQSVLKGVHRLYNKESNRADVLIKEFAKLGLIMNIDGDDMIIHGTGKLNGGTISSNNDHRIAMAAAIASVISENQVIIENAEVVKKSYPSFFEDFNKINLLKSKNIMCSK